MLRRDLYFCSCTRPTTTSSPISWSASTTASSSISWRVGAGKSTKSSFDRPVTTIPLDTDVAKSTANTQPRDTESHRTCIHQHVFLPGKIRAKLLKPENSEMKTVCFDETLDTVLCIALCSHPPSHCALIPPHTVLSSPRERMPYINSHSS